WSDEPALQAGLTASDQPTPLEEIGLTPQETIDQAVKQIEKSLVSELLDRLIRSSPNFFEHVVIELLVAMGYGKGRLDAGVHLGQSGDGGVDGVINQDPLGLDGVYIQAKRYALDSSIGEPDIRNFVGSLVGKAAHKGVFVTTCSFSSAARTYAKNVPH